MRAALLLPLFALVSTARAQTVLRLSTAAPEGTAWARAARAFARDVEQVTGGEVRIKWYFGGIAGDELAALERIKKEQLDGMAAAMVCPRLAPSMRAGRLLATALTYDEARHVMGRLKPVFDEEFHRAGFTNLVEIGLGPTMFFTRHPVRSLAELRKTRVWAWDIDNVQNLQLRAAGIPLVSTPLETAARAYDEGRLDGFMAIPAAALAFQWSTQTKYFTELQMGFLTGCVLVADRAFDGLSVQRQEAVRAAAAKFARNVDEAGRQQDEALLGGLFEKQGLERVPVAETFRQETLDALRSAREKLGEQLVPRALLLQVSSWLADFRLAQRPPQPKEQP